MALIHRATLSPTKLELLTAWLPGRPWAAGAGALQQAGAYRFDDPAGEVGLEAHILQADDGTVLHVPLTYRGAPLAGAEHALVGTTEHSVLGARWVYDGCADPVWVAALARAVLAGAPQAEELVDVDGELVPREPTARVTGSGSEADPALPEDTPLTPLDDGPTTVVRAGGLEVIVLRVLGTGQPADAHVLTGRWGTGGPATLAAVRPAP
ncbi:CG0192-related protein [Jiangella rhizosphaerae]|uniref:Maltokinase N-terminal cap domain-containing protein n=1 Tax=Jiangella rhizosphaerae TaxID=2293569 RepID=A0A418KP54_9ACTN|nr:hypothetical protein [Jiangella rhizosphaerae]RIQ21043.1 hypothetical protein DY240_15935 [Jiangella rhizosphaerae]